MTTTTSTEVIGKLQQQMAGIVKFNRDDRKKRERNLQLLSTVTTRR